MKKLLIILLLAIMASSIGCTNNNLENNINDENQDYPYSFSGLSTGAFTVQKGNNGYYFAINNFLYFADESNMTAIPLCNKNDCLHDKETDESKLTECNAYLFDNLINTDFYFINNKLYMLKDESYFEGDKLIVVNSIYEAKPDGTKLKKILSMNKQIIRWIIHRGIIYYTTDFDAKVEGFNLSDKSTKVYFDLDAIELYMPQLSNFFAYENKMYYCVSGYKNEKEFNDMLNGENISPFEYIYIYSNTGEFNYLLTSDISRDGIVYQGFKDNYLIYTDADYDKKIKYLYSLDQNGKKTKLNFNFENIYDLYYADDDFTYIKTGKTIDDMEKNIFNIYDEDGSLITTVDFPDGFSNEFFIGDNKNLFYLEDKEMGIKLYYIDKEELKKGNANLKMLYSS